VVKLSKALLGFEIVDGYGFACKPNSRTLTGKPVSGFGWEMYLESVRASLNMYKRYERPLIVAENGKVDARDRYRAWWHMMP